MKNTLIAICLLLIGWAVWMTSGVLLPQRSQMSELVAPRHSADTAATTSSLGQQTRAPRENPTARTESTEHSTLHGLLTQDGEELAGVRIEARDYRLHREGSPDAVLAATTSGPDGRFVMELTAKNSALLVFDHPRIVAGSECHGRIGKPGTTTDLGELRFPVPGTLVGQVVSEDGRPVAGAMVQSARFRRSSPGEPYAATQTDPGGRFRLERVDSDWSSVWVTAEGYVTEEYFEQFRARPGKVTDCGRLTLSEGRTVRGRVFDSSGAPIVGATLREEYGSKEVKARTGADGRFEIEHVGPHMPLMVECSGFLARDLDIPTRGDANLNVELERSRTLSGRVTGLDGTAAFVQQRYGAPVPVAADGTFRLEGLRRDTVKVHAFSARSRSVVLAIDLDHDRSDVLLEMLPQRGIELRVTDSIGQPVPDREILLVDAKLNSTFGSSRRGGQAPVARNLLPRIAEYRADGLLRPLEAETGKDTPLLFPKDRGDTLLALAPGYVPVRAHIAGGSTDEHYVLILDRGANLRGRVEGEDLEEASVRLTQHEGTVPPVSAPIMPDRSFCAELLSPGTYELRIRRPANIDPGYGGPEMVRGVPRIGVQQDSRAPVEVVLQAGDTQDIVLRAPPLGRIEGRVLDSGRGVPHARILIHDPEEEKRRSVGGRHYGPSITTDSEGRYAIQYGQPGTWEFQIEHPEGLVPGRLTTVLIAREAEVVRKDFELGTAAVQFHIDPQQLPQGNHRIEVRLFDSDLARADSKFSPHHGLRLDSRVPNRKVPPDGRVHLAAIPSGHWVLRIDGIFETLYQQVLDLAPGERVDLGRIDLATRVPVSLVVAPETKGGVWIRMVDGKRSISSWSATLKLNGGKANTELQPGTYEAELFSVRPNLLGIGITGKSAERYAAFEVLPDGTVEPPVLEFRTR